jgi:predicted secreted protein
MSWVTAAAMYVVIWWVVLFTVLPFGVRPSPEGDPGERAGAPENPRLLAKIVATTLISLAIWGAAIALIESGLISFREP